MPVAALAVVGLLVGVAGAVGPFRLPLGTATGGGGTSTDGYYTVHAAAGQAVTGTFAGNGLRLSAGLLGEGEVRVRRVVPAVARDP